MRNRILHIWVLSLHFSPRHDAFLALQMVNFSSLHDEGRPVNALHQFHLIELVNALRMVLCIMVDFGVIVNSSSSRLQSEHKIGGADLVVSLTKQ